VFSLSSRHQEAKSRRGNQREGFRPRLLLLLLCIMLCNVVVQLQFPQDAGMFLSAWIT
jgi:hypothetical protein